MRCSVIFFTRAFLQYFFTTIRHRTELRFQIVGSAIAAGNYRIVIAELYTQVVDLSSTKFDKRIVIAELFIQFIGISSTKIDKRVAVTELLLDIVDMRVTALHKRIAITELRAIRVKRGFSALRLVRRHRIVPASKLHSASADVCLYARSTLNTLWPLYERYTFIATCQYIRRIRNELYGARVRNLKVIADNGLRRPAPQHEAFREFFYKALRAGNPVLASLAVSAVFAVFTVTAILAVLAIHLFPGLASTVIYARGIADIQQLPHPREIAAFLRQRHARTEHVERIAVRNPNRFRAVIAGNQRERHNRKRKHHAET